MRATKKKQMDEMTEEITRRLRLLQTQKPNPHENPTLPFLHAIADHPLYFAS
jgi:hypothetical protein